MHRHHTREPDVAFVSEKGVRRGTLIDEAELLGEQFIASALTGEEQLPEMLDAAAEEEEGGPFLDVAGDREFAHDTDGSNPTDAEPALFPTAVFASPSVRRRG